MAQLKEFMNKLDQILKETPSVKLNKYDKDCKYLVTSKLFHETVHKDQYVFDIELVAQSSFGNMIHKQISPIVTICKHLAKDKKVLQTVDLEPENELTEGADPKKISAYLKSLMLIGILNNDSTIWLMKNENSKAEPIKQIIVFEDSSAALA